MRILGEENYDLWRSLERLRENPDFKVFLAHLDTRETEAARRAATARELNDVLRAQGAYGEVREILLDLREAPKNRSRLEDGLRGAPPAS